MTSKRVLAAVFGVLGVLVGAGLFAGAVWLLFEDRDDDGFYASEAFRFERSSNAIVSGDFDQLTEVPSWFADVVTDPVDEFWAPAIGSFEGKPFKSITRGAADLDKFEPETKDGKAKTPKKASAKSVDTLIAFLKLALKDAVKDVRTTDRLTDSPVCLVADESAMDMHLERLLKQHRQLDHESKRILEINPAHGVIKALAKTAEEKGGQAILEDAAFVLLDQARIMEGEPVPDPAAFGRRLSGLMEKGLAG